MPKKILTRNQFDILRKKKLLTMQKDKSLFDQSIKLIEKADKYMFIHQNNFFGEPSINFSEDLLRFQEAIYEVKPDIVIEVGVAWGGTTLFIASILEGINKGKVIGIDIYIPDHVKKTIKSKGKISKRIHLIEGSSIELSTINKIKKISKNKKILVILDSDHTEKHVYSELEIYSKLVNKKSYIIVCDTIINYIKPNKERKRDWGKKNNPLKAIQRFLKNHKEYQYSKNFNQKLLISCNFNGFIQKVK
jgi:cephalosporin hydroxylase